MRERLEALWRMESPGLIARLARMLGGDIGRAEELVQDCWLVFVARHPVLSADARVALTLRLLGGLTTQEIARAFLQPEATIAQRIGRAKRSLQRSGVPFDVPRAAELPARLQSVLEVVYLVFNEGYAASQGDDWMHRALCEEALRLGRILAQRLPLQAPAQGLLALMIAWAALQPLLDMPRLQAHAPPWVVRGELLSQLGRDHDVRHAFRHAASLSGNAREREVLLERAARCAGG